MAQKGRKEGTAVAEPALGTGLFPKLPLQTDAPAPEPAGKGETFQKRGCDLSKNKNKI